MLKIFFILLFYSIADAAYSQVLKKFSFSDCMIECKEDSSSVKEISKNGELTTIRVLTFAPCNGKFDGAVKIRNGIIDLTFNLRPTITKGKDGKTNVILEIADCDCPFEFTYEVLQVKNISEKTIIVNGLSLPQINKNRQRYEIDLGPIKQFRD